MFTYKPHNLLVCLLAILLLLSACKPSESAAPDVVKAYLEALVDKDQDRLLASICPEWETDALLELDALNLIETSLSDDLSCEQISSEENAAQVVCQGSIDATYGTEIQKFELSNRTFQVTQSGSDWLVCGYR